PERGLEVAFGLNETAPFKSRFPGKVIRNCTKFGIMARLDGRQCAAVDFMVMHHLVKQILFATNLYFGSECRNSYALTRRHAGWVDFYAGDFTLRDREAIVPNLILNGAGIFFRLIGVDHISILQMDYFPRRQQRR